MGPLGAGDRGLLKQRDGKPVAATGELLAASDFEALALRSSGEEVVESVFIGSPLEAVGKQEQAGFRVTGLPCMKEVVGGRQGEDVFGVERCLWFLWFRGRGRSEDPK